MKRLFAGVMASLIGWLIDRPRLVGWANWLARSLLSDEQVIDCYINAGAEFGDVSFDVIVLVECVGFDRRLNHWEFWEKEYIRRGYHSVHWKVFESYSNAKTDPRSKEMLQSFCVPMTPGEQPRYCATLYRDYRRTVTGPTLDCLDRAFEEADRNGGQAEVDTPIGRLKVRTYEPRRGPITVRSWPF